MTGERRPRIGPHLVLRAQVTLSYALQQSGLSRHEFADDHLYRERSRSRLMEKWLSGQSTLFRISAAALDKRIPGTLSVFELPLFELLANAPISERRVARLLEPYRVKEGHFFYGSCPWVFPDLDAKMADKTIVPIMSETDMENLKAYGTVDSFCVILGIMRAAEARGDLSMHLFAAQYVFRALPMVLKLPWFAPFTKELGRQLFRLRDRVLYSHFYFDVNWRLLLRQARDPKFHSYRYRWPRDPETGRFLEPADPILPAEVISGWDWHVRERRRANAKALRRVATRKKHTRA
jgi:hypothetical protein